VRIKSSDVDYESVREEFVISKQDLEKITIRVESFHADILTGGTPVADVNLVIEYPEEFKDAYAFEILYTEI